VVPPCLVAGWSSGGLVGQEAQNKGVGSRLQSETFSVEVLFELCQIQDGEGLMACSVSHGIAILAAYSGGDGRHVHALSCMSVSSVR